MTRQTSKLQMERVMQMSLDEYALQAGIYSSPMLSRKNNNSNLNHNNNNNIGLDDDCLTINNNEKDDNFFDETNEEMNISNFQNLDLRNRIIGQTNVNNNQNNNFNLPNYNSQQWRLMNPNISTDRPSGMPPLIQCNDELNTSYILNQRTNCVESNFNANTENLNYRNKNNNSNNNYNNNSNNYFKKNWRSRNRNKNYRNQPYNNQNDNFKNSKQNGQNNLQSRNIFQFHQNNNQQLRILNGSLPSNIKIEVNSSSINNASNGFSFLNMNNQRKLLDSSQNLSNSNFLNNIQNEFVRQKTIANSQILNGIPKGTNNELMSLELIAKTLLFNLQNGEVKEQKYDMKIQKEIHSLQKKPMIYKCPDGEVLSSDGPGLNVGFRPASTGISLNQRFA